MNNNLTIGDKLDLTGKVFDLDLGKSFDSSSSQNTPGFHTFRYDFKPASVDASQVARVDIEQRHQVSVTVPHHDSTSSTVFRGGQRQYQKECVLIIDHKTGEMTLEKLSCNVQLKKTRAEGSSKITLPQPAAPHGGRPLTPNTTVHSMPDVDLLPAQPASVRLKRPSPPMPQQKTHTGSPIPKQRISPVAAQRQPVKPSPAAPSRSSNAPSSLLANSMPMLLDDSGRFDDTSLNLQQTQSSMHQPVPSTNHYAKPVPTAIPAPLPAADSNTDVVEMSEASSSSSTSSGSSSDGSDSDSEVEPTPVSRPAPPIVPPPQPVPASLNSSNNYVSSQPSRPSMPKLSQLSEDLQLSESGSDSD